MKESTKDNVHGTIHELKGAAKEWVGEVTDNPKLKAEGTVEKFTGQTQQKVAKAEEVLEKVMDK